MVSRSMKQAYVGVGRKEEGGEECFLMRPFFGPFSKRRNLMGSPKLLVAFALALYDFNASLNGRIS